MADITAKLIADASDFNRALDGARKSIDNLSDAEKENARQFEKSVSAMQKAANGTKNQAQQLKVYRAELEKMVQSYAALSKEGQNSDFGKQMRSAIEATATRLDQLGSQMKKTSDIASKSGKKMADSFNGSPKIFDLLKDKLSSAVPHFNEGLNLLSKYGTKLAGIGAVGAIAMESLKHNASVMYELGKATAGFSNSLNELFTQLGHFELNWSRLSSAFSNGITLNVIQSTNAADANLRSPRKAMLEREIAEQRLILKEDPTNKEANEKLKELIKDLSNTEEELNAGNYDEGVIKFINALSGATSFPIKLKGESDKDYKKRISEFGYEAKPGPFSYFMDDWVVDLVENIVRAANIANLAEGVANGKPVTLSNINAAIERYKSNPRLEMDYENAKAALYRETTLTKIAHPFDGDKILLQSLDDPNSTASKFKEIASEKIAISILEELRDRLLNDDVDLKDALSSMSKYSEGITQIANRNRELAEVDIAHQNAVKAAEDKAAAEAKKRAEEARKAAEARRKAFFKDLEDWESTIDDKLDAATLSALEEKTQAYLDAVDEEIEKSGNRNTITGKAYQEDLSLIETAERPKTISEALSDYRSKLRESNVFTQTLDIESQSISELSSINGSFESLYTTLQNIGDIDNPFQFLDSIYGVSQEIISIIQTMNSLSVTMQELSAASKAASLENAQASNAETVADAGAASAKTFKAHASIPFVGIAIALGMVGAMIASIVSSKRKVSKYAYGGYVSGNQYSGDKVMIAANSGELVLNQNEQAVVKSLMGNSARTQQVRVVGELKATGKDLKFVLKNQDRFDSRR